MSWSICNNFLWLALTLFYAESNPTYFSPMISRKKSFFAQFLLHTQQGSKRSFYEHHYTWFILEQLLSRSVRIILLSVISKNEKFDKSIVWWFQSNRRSSKVISVLIWIYIFRPKWQSPRILRTIIRFHIFKFLCLVSLYILKVGALLMLEYPIN